VAVVVGVAVGWATGTVGMCADAWTETNGKYSVLLRVPPGESPAAPSAALRGRSAARGWDVSAGPTPGEYRVGIWARVVAQRRAPRTRVVMLFTQKVISQTRYRCAVVVGHYTPERAWCIAGGVLAVQRACSHGTLLSPRPVTTQIPRMPGWRLLGALFYRSGLVPNVRGMALRCAVSFDAPE